MAQHSVFLDIDFSLHQNSNFDNYSSCSAEQAIHYVLEIDVGMILFHLIL